MSAEWVCATCGERHGELPLCFGSDAPWRELVPEAELAERVELSDDVCVVDGKVFFVRGHIEIPIVGTEKTFAWSVWCSLSKKSVVHMYERWNDDDRDGDGYFGWLSTPLPMYPNTVGLKTNVRSRSVGVVPLVEVQECDHPLFVEQRNGMTINRWYELAHALLGKS